MRLLGDVRLIENENLAPPTVARARSRANQASKFEVCELVSRARIGGWFARLSSLAGQPLHHYCYSPGKYNWKPSLVEYCGEVAVLLGETHFNAGSRSRVRSLDYAVAIEGHNIRSRAARSRYQKLVR